MMDAFDMERVFYSEAEIRQAKLKFIHLVLDMESAVQEIYQEENSDLIDIQEKVVKKAYDVLMQQYRYPSLSVRRHPRSELLTHMLLNDALDCDGSCLVVFALFRRLKWNNIGIVNMPNHAFLSIRVNDGDPIYYDFGVKRTLQYYKEKYGFLNGYFDSVSDVVGKKIKGNLHGNIGVAWLAENEPFKAVNELTTALAFNLVDFRSYNNRGIAYQLLGKEDLAIADFSKALDIIPGDPEVLTNRGCSFYANGDVQSAVNDFLAADRAFGYYNLVCVYALEKEFSLALEFLSKAIEAGFVDIDRIFLDPDLSGLIDTSEFKEIIDDFYAFE